MESDHEHHNLDRDGRRLFFTRFGAGDIPGLLDLFADTIDFTVNGAPNIPWAGRHSHRDELTEFFSSFGQVLAPPEELPSARRSSTGARTGRVLR